MNSTGATATHDIGGDGKTGSINQYVGRDALGFNLNYFHGDYKPVNASVTPFPSYRVPGSGLLDRDYRPLYNGNISSMAYNIRMFESQGHTTVFANYRYDQLNRYKGQDNFFKFDKVSNSFTGTWDSVYTYKERVGYDANGNIQNYTRHNINPGGALMDELSYKYYPGTNQLRQVTDQVADNAYGNSWDVIFDIDNQSDTSNYVYDAIGNLIADKAEGITSIQWNVYGKIKEINRTATSLNAHTKIVYSYDAQGNRIGKVTNQGTGKQSYTWYVRDAQGNLMSTYTTESTSPVTDVNLGSLVLQQSDVQIYGSSKLGSLFPLNSQVDGGGNTGPYINPDYRGTTFYRGYRQYELSNHLGNVLTVINDRKIGVYSNGSLTLPGGFTIPVVDYYDPEMLAANDYFPFGMLSRTLGNSAKYKFGFNGKETDNEVKGLGSQQDYGMRIYDPRIGRFLSVDPLTDQFPWLSPFQYAGNNPVAYIDIDGAEPPPQTAPATPIAPAPVLQTPRPAPRVSVTIDPGLIDGSSGGRSLPRLPNIPSGPYGVQGHQPKFISQPEIQAKICDRCGASLNADGISITVWNSNGNTWQVSLLRTEPADRPLTWVDRLIMGWQLEKMNQFGIIKKQWNERFEGYELITNTPSSLPNDYLERVNRRLINGTASAQDLLYAGEVATRKEQKKINDPEKIIIQQEKNNVITRTEVDVPQGYKKIKGKSKGEPVYSNGKTFITPDNTGHNGGMWKMYDNEKNIGRGKAFRVGTYDANLKRVGD